MAALKLSDLFHSTEPDRDNFLSRVFGIFNEEIVRCWAEVKHAPYKDLGRPTLKLPGEKRGSTLDFTFESRTDGRVYAVEMKCWLAYESYRYLTLESPSQLERISNDSQHKAFRAFLDIGRNKAQYTITVDGKPQTIDGAILIWGSVTEQGRESIIKQYGLKDVLSLETIINDLIAWETKEYTDLIRNYNRLCGELFTALSPRLE